MDTSGSKMKRTPFGVRFTPALTSCPPAESRIGETYTPSAWCCNTDFPSCILAAKRADAAAEQPSRGATACQAVSAWEREIDERVYRLYGLTAEEIKMVEEGDRKG
jgi:hypothetical protein